MNRQPLVSVIIPTCNRPDFVARAVGSVSAQTWKSHEIIVVDDSTDDATSQGLQKSPIPLTYVKNAARRGAPFSRNVGLGLAQGEVICFLDDDDEWLPRKLEIQLAYLEKSPITSCSCVTVGGRKQGALTLPERVTWKEMLAHNFLGSCSFVMIERKALGECRFDETLKACQDWQMWLSVMKRNGITEVCSTGERLVRFNVGDHPRISNSTRNVSAVMALYDRFRGEYDASAIQALAVYNLLPIEGSFALLIMKEFMKCRMKGRGLRFLFQVLREKARGNTVLY